MAKKKQPETNESTRMGSLCKQIPFMGFNDIDGNLYLIRKDQISDFGESKAPNYSAWIRRIGSEERILLKGPLEAIVAQFKL